MINSPKCKFIPNKFRFSLKPLGKLFYDYQILCWNKFFLKLTNLVDQIFGKRNIYIFKWMSWTPSLHTTSFFSACRNDPRCCNYINIHLQGPPPCTFRPHPVVPTQTSFAHCLWLDAGSKWKQPRVPMQ